MPPQSIEISHLSKLRNLMYGDGGLSDEFPADINSLLHSSTFKHPSQPQFPNIKDFISSDSYSNYNHHQHGTQNHNHNHDTSQNHQRSESSLTRYRSAPSSFFAALLDCDDLLEEKFQSDSGQGSGIQKADFSPENMDVYGGSSVQAPDLGRSNFSGIYDHVNPNDMKSSSTFRSMNSSNSNLIRQSSSPAGFIASLNSETNDIRLKDNINFSPGMSSSPMFSRQVLENTNQTNDSTFKSLKRTRDDDSVALDRQNGLSGHYGHSLVHHLSLPNTSSEIAVAEKLLRFEQQPVPTNSRAKRGCATHPRSIAERVRRTRISNRMKKLQDLFPNMDKQTSIADMLDMAVKHIKDLQKDLQTLKDARSECTCSNKSNTGSAV